MDNLARTGTYFNNAIVTTPICAASRASILTGLHERSHNFNFQTGNVREEYMVNSYPALLKNNGYYTGFFGKYGVLYDHLDKQFDVYESYDRNNNFKDRRGYFYKTLGKDTVHLTRYTGQKALDFIDAVSGKDKPFCLSLSFSAPHAHDRAPDQYFWQQETDKLLQNTTIPEPALNEDKYFEALPENVRTGFNRLRWTWRYDTPEKYQHSLKGYYRMISGIDREIKKIREKLKEQGLDGNTVIILMGDNGYFLGDLKDYPTIESSGTSFFTFGLAWGINQGLLEKDVFEPVLFKAWNALVECVDEKGMLGFVQPIGAKPGESFQNYSEVYGVGAFLAAGSELYKYLSKFHPPSRDMSHSTFMKDGGWCWYQDPRAVISDGKLVISGISGQSGDVRIGIYDLRSEKIDSTVVLHENLEVDDHDAPALFKRPDDRILAVWAMHSREKIHYSSVTEPDNYLNWMNCKLFEHDYNHKKGVTYMNLFYLKNEGTLYNFFRDGLTFNPKFMKSNDFGDSWGESTHFIANDIKGYQRPYARYHQIDENTIGISYTDGHPRRFGNNIYYVEFSNNTFYKADGTKIKDINSGPLRTSEGEKLYIGSDTNEKSILTESVPNSAWTCAMGTDSQNYPHIGYSLYLNDSDHRFRISSWDGESWHDREIAYAGKCLYKIESSYTGLLAFDPEDPRKVYISTDVDPSTGRDLGGVHEIYTAHIDLNDDISTITWKPITSNSNYRNIRPIVVSDEGYKVLLWLNGPWNTFKDYHVDVTGIILKKPKDTERHD